MSKKRGKKGASIKVVTFGSAGILAVPNKLGPDADKILDHRLSTKKKRRGKTSALQKVRLHKSKKEERWISINLHHPRAATNSCSVEEEAQRSFQPLPFLAKG
jgi:hypothetical protein